MMFRITKLFVCLLACAAIAACGTIDEKRKVDYKTTRTLPPLEVPPDLTSLPDANLPAGAPTARTTYSEFAAEKKAAPAASTTAAEASPVLPQVREIRMERDRQARWLNVQAMPEDLWPRVREFVASAGFIIDRENPVAGVIETDWTENRAKVGTGGQMLLAKWLGSLYSTGTRDRYRIRLERGAQPGTTEIYVAHQGMEEVVSRATTGGEPDATRWQPRASEADLEIEMLRQLTMYLGKTEAQSKAIVAQAPAAATERAHMSRRGESFMLQLDDSLDRAWRRVGLSLDRVGFTVEDRDRSKGVYYVRYLDPDKSANEPGWFSRMFSSTKEAKKSEERYQIHLQREAAGTAVVVRNQDGSPEFGKTSERILGVLYEQLK